MYTLGEIFVNFMEEILAPKIYDRLNIGSFQILSTQQWVYINFNDPMLGPYFTNQQIKWVVPKVFKHIVLNSEFYKNFNDPMLGPHFYQSTDYFVLWVVLKVLVSICKECWVCSFCKVRLLSAL